MGVKRSWGKPGRIFSGWRAMIDRSSSSPWLIGLRSVLEVRPSPKTLGKGLFEIIEIVGFKKVYCFVTIVQTFP